MSSQQQFRSLGVALHSQLQSMRANVYLTLYYVRPQLAQAARAERRARVAPARASGSALPGSPATDEPASYATLLAAAYVCAPVLGLVSWRGLAPLLPGSAAAIVAGALLALLPSLIHVVHGAWARAALALASLLGYAGLGIAGGALLGRTLASVACTAQAHDECGLSLLGGLLVGAVAGGVFGYAVHGVRQVLRERPSRALAAELPPCT